MSGDGSIECTNCGNNSFRIIPIGDNEHRCCLSCNKCNHGFIYNVIKPIENRRKKEKVIEK